MGSSIGFYVHHHGKGHANRTRQIVEKLSAQVVIFSSATAYLEDMASERVRIVQLPSDVVPIREGQADWPDVFHYAPLQVAGIQQRMQLISRWIAREQPRLLVVDVSVEIALFARLCSLPTVIVRQHGIRNDTAHTAAFQSCISLLAPFSADLEDPSVPAWVRRKTCYAGGFSRFSQITLSREEARKHTGMNQAGRHVVIINGLGGLGLPVADINKAAEQTPDWTWWVLGPVQQSGGAVTASNLQLQGAVDNPYVYLKAADVVVGSAGNNTVMEAGTAQAKFICIPEERPFEEQFSKAAALQRMEAAMVLHRWPEEATRWPSLLAEAEQLDTSRWQKLIQPEGALLAARHIMQVADSVALADTGI